MPRFFTTDICGEEAKISGEDAKHITKSLRMQKGESLVLCGLDGFDYHAEIETFTQDAVHFKITEKIPCKTEPAVRVSLFQALPKSDKMEWIAQKAVELGVYEITPVLTLRCVSRWSEKDSEKKVGRLNKIMLEAAKQSGRGMIPKMHPLCSFEAAIACMKTASCAILFYECATRPLREILTANMSGISIMTGSEGGFSKEEVLLAEQNGVLAASLGTRILRCETAPVAAISAIQYAMGEF